MNLEQDATVDRVAPAPKLSASDAAPSAAIQALPIVRHALALLSSDTERFLACAPGRLDVMGGSSTYSGSLSLSVPLECHACAIVQRRSDGKISK